MNKYRVMTSNDFTVVEDPANLSQIMARLSLNEQFVRIGGIAFNKSLITQVVSDQLGSAL